MYNVRQLVVGDMASNCYIVSNPLTNHALVIDPADTPEYIGEKLLEMSLTPVAMIATHGHFDHVLAAFGLQVFFPTLPFYINREDAFLVERMQSTAKHFSGQRIVPPAPKEILDIKDLPDSILGAERMEILSLAGHTPGSIGIYFPDTKAVFVGDVLFADGSVGDTHHAYSDKRVLEESIAKIKALPPSTKIYSGHGRLILLADWPPEGVY